MVAFQISFCVRVVATFVCKCSVVVIDAESKKCRVQNPVAVVTFTFALIPFLLQAIAQIAEQTVLSNLSNQS